MLAANAKLQPRTGRTSAVDREAYEFAHSVIIECDNRNAQCHPLARVGLMATTKRATTCSAVDRTLRATQADPGTGCGTIPMSPSCARRTDGDNETGDDLLKQSIERFGPPKPILVRAVLGTG